MQEQDRTYPASSYRLKFLGAANFLQKIGASRNWAVAPFCPSGCHQEGFAYTPGISYLSDKYSEAEKSISRLIS